MKKKKKNRKYLSKRIRFQYFNCAFHDQFDHKISGNRYLVFLFIFTVALMHKVTGSHSTRFRIDSVGSKKKKKKYLGHSS